MRRGHRAGISLGLIIVILGGGAVGYAIGYFSPGLVFNLQHPLAEIVAGGLFALFSAFIWSLGEAITGLVRVVGRDATLVRVGISLAGSFISLVTAGLTLLNLHPFAGPDPHSIFAFGPIASGLGSVALGAHALIHQLNLDRAEKLGGY